MGPNMRPQRQHGPPHPQFYPPQQYRNYRPTSANYYNPNKQNPANHYGPYNQSQQSPRKPQSDGQNNRQGDRLNPEERKSDLDPHSNPFVPLQVSHRTQVSKIGGWCQISDCMEKEVYMYWELHQCFTSRCKIIMYSLWCFDVNMLKYTDVHTWELHLHTVIALYE